MIFNRADKKTAICSESKGITYAELKQLTEYTLEKLNNKTNLVVLVCDKSMESISLMFALINSNQKIVIVDEKTLDNDIFVLIERYRIEYIISCKNIFDDKYSKTCAYGQFGIFKTGHSLALLPNELSILLSTSGTTGETKMVKIHKDRLKSVLKFVSKEMCINEEIHYLCVSPLHYCMGLVCALAVFYSGGVIVAGECNVCESSFWNKLDLYNNIGFCVVPYSAFLLDKMKFFDSNHDNVSFILEGGGKSNQNLTKKFIDKDRGYTYYRCYGQTETVWLTLFNSKGREGSFSNVGETISSLKITVAENGELIASGKDIFGGYAQNFSDLYQNSQQDIFCTGDLGYVDDRNNVYITGRISRYSKIHGLRISYDRIELILSEKYDSNFACVGNDAKVLIFTDCLCDTSEIIEYLAAVIRINKSFINVVREFPRLTNNKVDYRSCKKILEEE